MRFRIPEDVIKETVDLETVIVLIIASDGGSRKCGRRKNPVVSSVIRTLREQSRRNSASPIPDVLDQTSLECVIQFTPD